MSGRPKSAKPRRHAATAWLSGEEMARVVRAAGKSLSAWARKVLLEAADAQH